MHQTRLEPGVGRQLQGEGDHVPGKIDSIEDENHIQAQTVHPHDSSHLLSYGKSGTIGG